MDSAVYEGVVTHRRRTPTKHAFKYRLFMMFLDLDALPTLFDRFWLWSVERSNVAAFMRSDHLGGNPDLKTAVLDRVESQLQIRPAGKVFLLTHLRYFGHVFNPISLYFCYDKSNKIIQAVLAEVHNTPWGEQHSYVLDLRNQPHLSLDEQEQHIETNKEFHVSPFMPMDMQYRWVISQPAKKLHIGIQSWRENKKVFAVDLSLNHAPISHRTLRNVLLRFPFMTLRIIFSIHFQALKLWLKRTPIYAHKH